MAVESSLEGGSVSPLLVGVARSLAAAHRLSEPLSGGSRTASTPCCRANAAPFRSISLDIAAANLVPLPEAAATRFSRGIMVQSEPLTRTHGTMPIRERASSWPR